MGNAKQRKDYRIAFFDLKDWWQGRLEKTMSGLNASYHAEQLEESTASLAKDADILGIFVRSAITKKLLAKLPKLKYIATMSTGYDHIDLGECKKRGIIVSNVPAYGENTVAEHTFGLILSLTRKIPQSYDRTTKANFSLEGLQGTDLQGKTLGIVGTGHIGQHVIRIAKGFEMKVIAYDAFPNKSLEKKLGFRYKPLDYLLCNADIITLHVPYSKLTHHMINKGNVFRIKKGAIIVNTSRGGAIDTEALTDALVEGHLGGAALDVLEEEGNIMEEKELIDKARLSNQGLKTMLRNHVLVTLPNVIITPHNAFNSREALERILDTSCDNIKSYTKGKIKNQVMPK